MGTPLGHAWLSPFPITPTPRYRPFSSARPCLLLLLAVLLTRGEGCVHCVHARNDRTVLLDALSVDRCERKSMVTGGWSCYREFFHFLSLLQSSSSSLSLFLSLSQITSVPDKRIASIKYSGKRISGRVAKRKHCNSRIQTFVCFNYCIY